MIIDQFTAAVRQSSDPRFRKVFIFGTLMALGLFALLLVGMIAVWPESLDADYNFTGIMVIDWLINQTLNGIFWLMTEFDFMAKSSVFLFTVWFLFPAVSTLFMGLFLDDIVDAVEEKHYPTARSTRKANTMEAFGIALRIGLMSIILNLLALPFYIILLFTGIGPIVLYYILNSYLFGSEYFEMVASRHFIAKDANKLRRLNRDKALMGGALITFMFSIPVVNIFTPIIGAAMMVHVFHSTYGKGQYRTSPVEEGLKESDA